MLYKAHSSSHLVLMPYDFDPCSWFPLRSARWVETVRFLGDNGAAARDAPQSAPQSLAGKYVVRPQSPPPCVTIPKPSHMPGLQNHRMLGVGRDLWGSSRPTLLLRAGCTGPCPGGSWISPEKETNTRPLGRRLRSCTSSAPKWSAQDQLDGFRRQEERGLLCLLFSGLRSESTGTESISGFMAFEHFWL